MSIDSSDQRHIWKQNGAPIPVNNYNPFGRGQKGARPAVYTFFCTRCAARITVEMASYRKIQKKDWEGQVEECNQELVKSVLVR